MKEKKILIATTNPGKFHEIMEVLGGLPFEFVFLGDLDVAAAAIAGRAGDFVEDGETFYENAVKKAEYFSGKTGLMALAEDSGILVDSLSGELGV
ncbi:MAG: non-canonical purine NTP pyrophosphatase, partial [Candidatus Peregrinibacteria bacterium]